MIDGLLALGIQKALERATHSSTSSEGGAIAAEIMSYLAILGYFVYSMSMMKRTGQTPGKKFLKIKVVDEKTGKVPTLTTVIIRETVGKFLSTLVFYIGYLWAWKDKNKQTWHDKIAHTIVVNE